VNVIIYTKYMRVALGGGRVLKKDAPKIQELTPGYLDYVK
jgi:hypothetical protein